MRHLSFPMKPANAPTNRLADRLGINLIRSELPPGLEIYARTPDITPETFPSELSAGHHIAEDAWGLIRVLEGAVLYALDDPGSASLVLRPGECAVIEPQTLHSLQFVEPGRFFIEFHLPRHKLHPEELHRPC